MGMTFEELEAKNGRRKDRVEVKNLRCYAIGFPDADKKYGHPGFLIQGYERNTTLSLEEVYGQINQAGNIAFVGTDGKGKNASLRIVDPVVRAYCFDEEKLDPLQLTDENIKKLLAMNDKNKFSAFMEELIATEGDKKEISFRMANDMMGLKELSGWKEMLLERHIKEKKRR